MSQQALKSVIYVYYTPAKMITEIYVNNNKLYTNPREYLQIYIFSIITFVYIISIVPENIIFIYCISLHYRYSGILVCYNSVDLQ